MKLFRKAEVNLAAVKGMIPNLGFQKEDCKRVLAFQAKEKREQLKALEDLNRDIDIFINDFLQEESLEKDKVSCVCVRVFLSFSLLPFAHCASI